MSRRTTVRSALFGTALLLAGCGSSGSGSPADSVASAGNGGTGATTAPAATTSADATAPATADGGSGSGGGGDFSGRVCDLLTLDEMSAALEIPADKQDEQPFTQGSGTCGFSGNGGTIPVGAVTLVGGSTTDANVPWNIYKSDASSVPIPVNGAEAIWYTNANSAIVLKNGYLGTIILLAPKGGDAKAAASGLTQALADRMP